MNLLLTKIRDKNLETGYGVSKEEIVSCIGEDRTFDERVMRLSPKRFKSVMKAYKKRAIKESKTSLKELLSAGGKVFKDTNDYYLADRSVVKITVDALEYGSFRVPNEKDSWGKANKAYEILMRYLIDNDEPSAQILDGIRIEQPKETLTLVEFINSKKAETREAFFSYRQEEYKDDRFNSIFASIRKEVKTVYEYFKKNEARRLKKGEPLLSTTKKINMLIENMNTQTEHRNEAIKDIDNTNKEKALIANTLTHEHNLFHKK